MKQPDPFLEVPSMMTYLRPRQLTRPIYIVSSQRRTPARVIQPRPIHRPVWMQPISNARSTSPIQLNNQKDTLTLQVALPGVDTKDLEIQASRQAVTIVARTTDQTQTFRRIINLPSPVQHTQINAQLTNGILTLTLPKAQPSPAQVVKVKISPVASPAHQPDPTGQAEAAVPAVESSLVTEPVMANSDVDPVLSTVANDRAPETLDDSPASPGVLGNDPELSVDLWAAA